MPTKITNPYSWITGVILLGCLIALVSSVRRVPIPDAGSVQERARSVVALIDPNTATDAELAALPAIGPVMAGRIIEYRKASRNTADGAGPVFERVEDLARVRGIGPKTVEKLRPWVRFARDHSTDQHAPE